MDARANLVTILFVSTLIATLVSAPSLSRTQEWPARQPIRVLVALTPGSATDLVSRLVFEQVGKQIGQIVVIENRAGASQTTAASAVAKAERDGYTILAAGSALAVVPSNRLNQEIVKPIETLQVRERLESIGGSASPLSAHAFADQFKREIAIDAALVKAAGLEAN